MAENMKGKKIQKWDEVTGAEIEIGASEGAGPDEMSGAGPSISKNPIRGIEDMVEQNDNNFDGVINNLPEVKPAAQVSNEDVIEEIQKKKSILEKIKETIPDPSKERKPMLCPEDLVRS